MQIEQRSYHVYNVVNGTELGSVKEFTAPGAINWASFLFNESPKDLAVSEVPISPQSLALLPSQRH